MGQDDHNQDLESLEKTQAVDWSSTDGEYSPAAAAPQQMSAPAPPPRRAPPATPPPQHQPLPLDDDESDLEATVALPDTPAAALDAPGPPPLGGPRPLGPAAGPAPLGGQQPLGPAPLAGPPPGAQAAAPTPGYKATELSRPRPEAADVAAQTEIDPSILDLEGPRSLTVLLLVALLGTICLVGVGAILFYKYRNAPSATPAAAPASSPSALIVTAGPRTG